MFAFKCGNDSTNGMKGISKSQSKHIKFEKYKKCLDEEKNQGEQYNYYLKSIDHDMYLQEIKKSTLSFFDDKRWYKNKTETKLWI